MRNRLRQLGKLVFLNGCQGDDSCIQGFGGKDILCKDVLKMDGTRDFDFYNLGGQILT